MTITESQNTDPCPTPPKPKKSLKSHLNASFDPSKPLKQPKYEIIAKEIAKGSNQTDAYLKAYPKATLNTARGNASDLISREGINLRALKLLEEVGLTESELAKSLKQCVNSSTEQIKLEGTKFGFKLLGYGQDQKLGETSYNPTQINIVIRSNRETLEPKSNDVIDIETNDA